MTANVDVLDEENQCFVLQIGDFCLARKAWTIEK